MPGRLAGHTADDVSGIKIGSLQLEIKDDKQSCIAAYLVRQQHRWNTSGTVVAAGASADVVV